MIGAICGDIVGSRFEFCNNRSKDFEFFAEKCFITDDSIMTLSIAKAIMETWKRMSNPNENDEEYYQTVSQKAVHFMRKYGLKYPAAGYGMRFNTWLHMSKPVPYNSFGNGAAMRISAVGFVAKSIEEAIMLSRKVTEVTHNHPEGIKGAEATAVAIFLAKNGSNIKEIKNHIDKNYYKMNFKLDNIRETYKFNETCQETVPQAITAFLESISFEDAIRNAISIGGDSDTLASITGGIAEAYYGIPNEIKKQALIFLDERLLKILIEFENKYPLPIKKTDI